MHLRSMFSNQPSTRQAARSQADRFRAGPGPAVAGTERGPRPPARGAPHRPAPGPPPAGSTAGAALEGAAAWAASARNARIDEAPGAAHIVHFFVKLGREAVTRCRMRDDIGKLILRLCVGGLMLFHGIAKVQHGVGGIVGGLQAKGLPGLLAYGVYLGEVLVPLLLIIGLYTRPSAIVLAINMLFAIWLVHAKDIAILAPTGAWGVELQMLYLLGAVAIAFLGSGRLAVSRGRGALD
jgi:putative oxidoreductase